MLFTAAVDEGFNVALLIGRGVATVWRVITAETEVVISCDVVQESRLRLVGDDVCPPEP